MTIGARCWRNLPNLTLYSATKCSVIALPLNHPLLLGIAKQPRYTHTLFARTLPVPLQNRSLHFLEQHLIAKNHPISGTLPNNSTNSTSLYSFKRQLQYRDLFQTALFSHAVKCSKCGLAEQIGLSVKKNDSQKTPERVNICKTSHCLYTFI